MENINNIEVIRIRQGVSLDTLASRLEISAEELEQIERNQTKVSIEQIAKIADVLNVSVNEIIGSKQKISNFERKRLVLTDVMLFVSAVLSVIIFVSTILCFIFLPNGENFRYQGIYYLFANWSLDYVVAKLILLACIAVFIVSITFICLNKSKYKK